jgi:predicted nucleic acid-binding protein
VTRSITYLDSSAVVKLISRERETRAMAEFLSERPETITSAITPVEVRRAVRRARSSQAQLARAEDVLERLNLLAVDDYVLSLAGEVEPVALRSLDAIQLASALSVREHLRDFIAYDVRLGQAAREAGLETVAPG